jgi:hypothetical protein
MSGTTHIIKLSHISQKSNPFSPTIRTLIKDLTSEDLNEAMRQPSLIQYDKNLSVSATAPAVARM